MPSKKNNQTNNFLTHGAILAVASILVRLIGMIYRIPMVHFIGSTGNGYYSTAYSVYSILLLLSSYSMPLAVSKMVSARVTKGKWKETERVIIVATGFGVVVGAVFAAVAFFGADFFCTKVMKSPMAAIALKWMAPTIFVMAVLGVLRGFFQGLQTTIPTAISQIIEQIINAIFSILMAFLLFRFGGTIATETGMDSYAPAWGAAGGTIGTGAGALAALIFMAFLFMSYSGGFRTSVRRDTSKKVRPYGKLIQILTLTAVPVIMSTAAYNCIDIIDVAFFNNYMAHAGILESTYTAIWGDYNSAYLLLIHLPVAFAAAIGSALVPSLTAAYVQKDKRLVMKKIDLTIRVTLLIAIPCALGMMAIGGNLAKLLFPSVSDDAMKYLVIGGVAVITYSLSTVTNAILQGLNKMSTPMIHAFISLVLHIGVLALLLYVFKLQINAVIISYVLFSLTMTILNFISIHRLTGYVPDGMKCFAYPTVSAAIMVIFCFGVVFLMTRFVSGKVLNLLIVVVGLIVGIIVYFVGILFSGILTPEFLKEIPFGRKLIPIVSKLSFRGRR